jgi:hypothetical protein
MVYDVFQCVFISITVIHKTGSKSNTDSLDIISQISVGLNIIFKDIENQMVFTMYKFGLVCDSYGPE